MYHVTNFLCTTWQLVLYHVMNFYAPRVRLMQLRGTLTKKWLRNFNLEHLSGIFEIIETLIRSSRSVDKLDKRYM